MVKYCKINITWQNGATSKEPGLEIENIDDPNSDTGDKSEDFV